MGGKVIKINLVGAIITIIVVIAAIIGLVMFFNRPKDTKDNDKDKIKVQKDVNDENYKELDTNDYVTINNQNKEVLMRQYISKKGFRIEYDVNSFYVDEAAEAIKSLVSDSIAIRINRLDENYNELVTTIKASSDRMKAQYPSFDLKETSLGNKNVIIYQLTNEAIVERTYYVETLKGFIEVKVSCGKDYVDTTFPIVDKMVSTVEIM